MIIDELGNLPFPQLEHDEWVDAEEMRQQAIAQFYGWA